MEDNLKYEIRQVEALQYDDCWNWNESFHIADIEISLRTTNIERALLHQMRKHGIVAKRGMCRLETYDGSMYELVVRKTGEPLVAFIPKCS